MGYKTGELGHTSLYDRVKKLLVSFEWSDCCFSISGKRFKAHKLIMGISSPVFEAMFYGPLSTNCDIIITDIEPDTFQLLLNYIYTDKVEISSIEEAFELLYASKKYLLEHLTEMCIEYIQANISIDNVTTILNYPEFMHDKELVSSSQRLFCEHANYLLQEYKRNISLTCLTTILKSNQMNINEKDLIKHVFDWTAQYCEQNDLPKSLISRRNVLIENDLLKLLRFCALSLSELDELIEDENNIIFPHEVSVIKQAIIASHNSNTENELNLFCANFAPRHSIKLHWYLCYRSPLRSVAPIVIDSNNYLIHSKMKANKSVFITSLCIPTRMAPELNFHNNTTKIYSEQISVSIVCESDNSIVKYTNFMNTVEYDSVINIELSEPCFIKKDKWHKITFAWLQNRSLSYSYMVEYRDRVYRDHKILFEFEDLSSTRINGSFLGGLKFCL